MDTFVEQIVERKKTGKDIAFIVGILILAAVLIVFSFVVLWQVALLLILALGYGAWRLITSQNIEHEYSITNGDIDIDQIIARRKRKRVVSVSGHKIESAGVYKASEFTGRTFDRFVMAASSPNASGVWYFIYRSKKSGSTLVLFEPNDRVLEAFKAALPKLLQLDINRKQAQA